MVPPRPEVIPVDGSALCRECGLCCDWSIFRNAGLQPNEVEWAVSRRLPLLQHGKDLSFALPCVLLEAHDGERVCGDYEHRPSACRSFECKVLAGYKRGDLSRTDAFALVRKARLLVTKVEQRLAGTTLYEPFTSKLDALAEGAGRAGSPSEREPDVETLLDIGALRSVIKAFHDHRPPSAPDVEDVPELLARATDPAEWERLFASAEGSALQVAQAFSPSPPEGAVAELRAEGYTRLGPIVAPEEACALASLVSRLAAAGWPAVFLFMHPRVWEIARRCEAWLETVLGNDYELLAAVWAWNVVRGAPSGGWQPHRERSGVTVEKDGSPQSLTIWIALTDATPDNGCVYILPPEYDPFYGVTGRVSALDIQNVRALPAAAGTALAWNHQVVHWGGRSSSNADRPRISLAFEFRRPGTLEESKAIDRSRVPSFGERLACIAAQILDYRHFGGADERFVRLAAELAGPRLVAPPDVRGAYKR